MNPTRISTKLLFCVAGGLALLAGPRLLADEPDAAATFKSYDTDADGKISPAEYTAGLQQGEVRKLDTNKDGKVSDEERAAAQPAKKHWWSRSETPGIDPETATKAFQALDVDKDGFLNETEFNSGQDAKK